MSYFQPFYAHRHSVLPGLGTIHSQSVGSTSRTAGLDHYFLPHGADRQIPGHVRFAASIDRDGSVVWTMVQISGPSDRVRSWSDPRPTETTQTDFPAQAMAEMRRLSETLEEREPDAWFHHAHDAISGEIDEMDAVVEKHQRTVEHLTLLLDDPSEPREHFVSAADSGTGKGFFREATAQERAERRAFWTTSVERARSTVSRHGIENGRRYAMLKRMRSALLDWAKQKSLRGLPSVRLAAAVGRENHHRAA